MASCLSGSSKGVATSTSSSARAADVLSFGTARISGVRSLTSVVGSMRGLVQW